LYDEKGNLITDESTILEDNIMIETKAEVEKEQIN